MRGSYLPTEDFLDRIRQENPRKSTFTNLLENEHTGAGCPAGVCWVVPAPASWPEEIESWWRRERKPRKTEPQRDGVPIFLLPSYSGILSRAIPTSSLGTGTTGIINEINPWLYFPRPSASDLKFVVFFYVSNHNRLHPTRASETNKVSKQSTKGIDFC